MLKLIIFIYLFFLSVNLTHANDFKKFMGEKIYTNNSHNCDPDKRVEPKGKFIDKSGLYGSSFACTFISSKSDKVRHNDELVGFIIQSACGDDSGIYRGDLLAMEVINGQSEMMTVQSQNEYTVRQTLDALNDSSILKHKAGSILGYTNFISDEYKLCK